MVRIIRKYDFWWNVETHKDLILRCFRHLKYTQFRSNEPEESELVDLYLGLKNRNVFRLFNQRKVHRKNMKKKRGRPKKGEGFKYVEIFTGLSDEEMRKKFETYLYQRIWAILWYMYNERRKYRHRYKTVRHFDGIHPACYQTPERLYDDESTEETYRYVRHFKDRDLPREEIEEIKRVKFEDQQKDSKRKAGSSPTIDDVDSLHSYERYTVEDHIAADDILKVSLSLCRTEEERKIVQLRAEHCSRKQIACMLGMDAGKVSDFLKKLLRKYQEKAVV